MPADSQYKTLQKAHSPLKADVYLDETTEPASVIKDYSRSPAWLRTSLCQLMLGREIRTLVKLAGVPGVPRFFGTTSKYAYRMEYIPGQAPDRQTLGSSLHLLSQLADIVEQMHTRGVTHNDLRPDNLIATPDQQLYLIDFGAVCYRPKSNRLLARPGHWLFNYLRNTDNSKIARLKSEFHPETLSPAERALIDKTRIARKSTKYWKKYVLPLISPSKHRKRR